MKTMQQLSSFTMGRMLLHVVCAVLRPAHLSWHWQGIRRELLPSVQRLALAALAALPGVALAQFGPSFLSAPDGNPTNALIVANGGNIGIGTTNPADRLVVVGNFLVQGGTAPDFDSSGLRFGNAPEGYRWIQSYDGQPLVLNPLQNRVGIGTTNPGRQLHVVERNGVVAAEFETARETCAIRLNAAGVGGRVWTLESTEGSFNLGDSTANANRFTINTLGKIGIGTTTPQVELDVEGDIAVRSGRELQLNSVDNSVTARIKNPTIGSRQIAFLTGDASLEERMRINGAGNVGIHTPTPQAPLDVNGKINCTVLELTSDRNAKAGFAAVDNRELLQKVARLPLSTWHHTNAPGVRHLGPMAQDFQAAFHLGTDDKHIATVDADGVLFASVQALHEELQETKTQLAVKDARITALEQKLAQMETLAARLTNVEKLMAQAAPVSNRAGETAATISESVSAR